MSVFSKLEKEIADISLRRNYLPEEIKTLMRIITKLCREGQKLEAENANLKERIKAADLAIAGLLRDLKGEMEGDSDGL